MFHPLLGSMFLFEISKEGFLQPFISSFCTRLEFLPLKDLLLWAFFIHPCCILSFLSQGK